MRKYDLGRILKEQLKNSSGALVTRLSGQAVREHVERGISSEKDGAVVALDFSRIGIIDYSCADEIVAKLIYRLLGGEYGDRYIVLTGLNENQKENIEVALERKGLAVMARMNTGQDVLLGNLNNYLKDTLHFITERGRIAAGELSERFRLPANTSGTRLLNLHKKRLVKRMDEIRNGGRVWVYERI